MVAQYGADSLRLYEMFMGPLRDTKVRAALTMPDLQLKSAASTAILLISEGITQHFLAQCTVQYHSRHTACRAYVSIPSASDGLGLI